ncbi:MAG: NYN domain-containing protein [Candidatus Bathyarchaeota archaeon]|nr:NYN domain-containing protein [Candidatus Bathyarchaeum sp.]
MKRVQCYIDGFNLYHAIADLNINHLKWVNLWSLSEAFIQPSKEVLREVFYFTAYAKWIPQASRRHKEYVEALKSYGVAPVFGHFKNKKVTCRSCGSSWTSREEKGTDTNFVIQLVQEAHQNHFDKAIIVTADSDMVPAIHMVLNTFPNKEILVCTPPGRYDIAREIRGSVETKKMKQKHLKNNLLPENIYCPAGQIVATRPADYAPPAV